MTKWVQRKPLLKYKEDDLLIEKVAKIRGISNIDDWLNPPKKYVHSPYLLDNIEEAVNRIIKAIHKGEKIQIFGDVDGDGIASTGVMYNYLKELTDNVSYFHAQRSEGHGIENGLNIIDKDTKLLIIVDSSSNSVEACKKIKEDMGIDIIVIDHHIIDSNNPYAIIVNCQQGNYPNKHLSGSAMCYKVCQVLDEYLDLELSHNFIDLCAIGLIGDMMDIKDMENRYLIYKGLNNIKNLGIQEILKQSNIDYSNGIKSLDVSFKVAPIMSACSRYDKIELAMELVTTNDEDRVKKLAKMMIELNEKRKLEQKESVEKVLDDLENSDTVNHNLIIYISEDIESGFRGLVATEIVERFQKPVFIVKPVYNDNGDVIQYSGSARSVGQLPLKEMCQDSNLFIFAIGHSSAFGVSFDAKNFNNIIEYFDKNLSEEDFEKVFYYDLEIDVEDISEEDIKDIEKFSKIVGAGFPEPTFRVKGLVVEESYSKKLGNYCRAVMGGGSTVKVVCENDFSLMKFRTNENFGKDIEEHFYNEFITELEAIGTLNLNIFYNWSTRKEEVTKQVFVQDYKIVSAK